jgi:uncharacterized protein (DUF433 family)
MARYPLNLPVQLKEQAEHWAQQQGVSLNQFIMWAVAEKVGSLAHALDDPAFPHITYRRGAAGIPEPVLRGTGIRVQTLIIAAHHWEMTPEQIAEEYGLHLAQVQSALDFYAAHQVEVDTLMSAEESLADVPEAMPV